MSKVKLYERKINEQQINGEKISIRKQKIRKNHTQEKLIFFTILVIILLIIAAFAKKLCPYDPYAQDLLLAQKPPSAEHILGTDRYGRDMFSRVLAGSTTSIYATLLLVAIVTVTGTVIGLVCGWCGGIVDTILMRISESYICIGCRRSSRRWDTECGHCTGCDRMAKVCKIGKRTDTGAKGFCLSDGCKDVWQQYAKDII